MNSCGIDLSQHKVFSYTFNDESNYYEISNDNTTPFFVLPQFNGEQPLLGEAATQHRRGSGYDWPPECQVPYLRDSQYGSGRIPLVAAWWRLAPGGNSFDEWSGVLSHNTSLSWTPTPDKPPVSILSEQIICKTAKLFSQNDTKQTALVVPDHIGEAAQQALLDIWNRGNEGTLHLTPRPIAIAADWCRQNSAAGRNIADESAEGKYFGRIAVLSLSLDVWETVLFEIRAKNFNGNIYLFPVRDRTEHSFYVPINGFFWLVAIASLIDHGTNKSWRYLQDPEWLMQCAKGDISGINLSEISGRECGIKKYLDDSLRGIMPADDMVTLQQIPDIVSESFEKQFNDLSSGSSDLLSVIVDGACANFPVGPRTMAEFALLKTPLLKRPIISSGEMTSRGAAWIAFCLQNNLPTYRDKLMPIEICAIGRDSYYDPQISYKQLVPDSTVEAGKTYYSPIPITGLTIAKGQDSLTLELRRRKDDDSFYKKVKANLREKTAQNEDVILESEVQPGQGFAKVRIKSVRPRVFESTLNWRLMGDCETPSLGQLSWPLGKARIKADDDYFNNACDKMTILCDLLESNHHAFYSDELRPLREQLNKWPTYDTVQSYRGVSSKPEPYLYIGPLSSDDTLNNCIDTFTLNRLRNCIEEELKRPVSRFRDEELINLSAWLYQACPEHAKHLVIQKIDQKEISRGCLMLIGNVFEEEQEVQLFYNAFVKQIRNYELQCLNDKPKPINNWLRAFRNLVRFRVKSVDKKHLHQTQLDEILPFLIKLFAELLKENNLGQRLDNCFYIFPHLLKRRKFDSDFLTKGSSDYKNLLNLLLRVKKYCSRTRYKEAAKSTIPFLERSASKEDMDRLWITESDSG
jgi:hypothetical protein